MRPAAALAALAFVAGPVQAGTTVTIDGSQLVVVSDGRAFGGVDLTGAELTLDLDDGTSARVRIDRALADSAWPDTWLYDLSIDEDGAWKPVCEPEHDGFPHAILQTADTGGIAILCTAGALAKCIRFGYRPWASLNGIPLAPYWRACVRLVRADYCGTPTTLDGMLIELHDDLGIQTPEPGLAFEAGWTEAGAVCVAHTRVPQKASLDSLAVSCPRLAPSIGPACTEPAARAAGAVIFNASRGDGIPEADR